MKGIFLTTLLLSILSSVCCSKLIEDRGHMIFVNDLGVESSDGTWSASETNWPGPRLWSLTFYHFATDSIYMLGGCTAQADLFNLARSCNYPTSTAWKFNPRTLQWTRVTFDSGSYTFVFAKLVKAPETEKVYVYMSTIVYEIEITDSSLNLVALSTGSGSGTKGDVGVASVNYYPSPRNNVCLFGQYEDVHFILYLFGGRSSTSIKLSDMWKFNTSSSEWTLLRDTASENIANVGVFHENTWPDVPLYCEGFQFDADDTWYYVNNGDMMSYSMTLQQWKYIGTTIIPGNRYSITLDETKRQAFFIGGFTNANLNRIYRYDMTNETMELIYGTTSGSQADVYTDGPGNITTSVITPIMGDRSSANVATDQYQNIWIYGSAIRGTSIPPYPNGKSDFWVISRCELDFLNLYDYPAGTQRPCFTECGAGLRYSLAVDECLGCPAGSWSLAEATTCNECVKGEYSGIENATSIDECTSCAAGSYSTSDGASACDLCSEGKYSTIVGATTSTVCILCPAGSYADSEGGSSLDSACIECPQGRWSDAIGSTTFDDCEQCDLGFYNDETGSVSDESCKLCPLTKGLSCPKGAINPFIESGYWRDENNPTKIFQCLPSKACKSTGYGSTQCADGYVGDKCSACDEGYYRLNGSCNECPPEALKWVFAAFIMLIAVYALLRLSTPGRIAGVEMRMFVFWIQIISLYSSMSAAWPSELLTVFDIVSFANANLNIIYSPDCSTDSIGYFTWIYLKLGFTPAVVIFMGLLFSLQELNTYLRPNSSMVSIFYISWNDILSFFRIVKRDQSSPVKVRDEFRTSRYIFASLSVVTILYTMEIASLFEPFNCVEQDGKYVVIHDPTQECYTDTWYESIPYLLGFCVLYIFVIPVVLIFILIRYREDLNTDWFQARFSMLTYSYNHHYYWYEMITMVKRCLVIGASDSLSYRVSETSKIFVVLSILLAFTVLDCLVNPFRDHGLYSHNLIWSCTAILLLMSTSVYASDSSTSEERRILTFILIVFICVAVTFSILRFSTRVRFAAQRRQRFQTSALRNITWEMHGFLVSFRNYVNSMDSGSEQSKMMHVKHWRYVSRELQRISLQVQETLDMITDSCTKSRIRPGSVLSIDPEIVKIMPFDMTEEVQDETDNSIIQLDDRDFDPEAWEEVWDEQYKRPYWFNKITNSSVWVSPFKVKDQKKTDEKEDLPDEMNIIGDVAVVDMSLETKEDAPKVESDISLEAEKEQDSN